MEILKANLDYIIFGILGFMAFVAVWCVIERLLFFRKVKASDYQRQDDFDNALSENLTALYIIYSNAPYVGLLWHCAWHNDSVLRYGAFGQYRCQVHSHRAFAGFKSHSTRAYRGYTEPNGLQRPTPQGFAFKLSI